MQVARRYAQRLLPCMCPLGQARDAPDQSNTVDSVRKGRGNHLSLCTCVSSFHVVMRSASICTCCQASYLPDNKSATRCACRKAHMHTQASTRIIIYSVGVSVWRVLSASLPVLRKMSLSATLDEHKGKRSSLGTYRSRVESAGGPRDLVCDVCLHLVELCSSLLLLSLVHASLFLPPVARRDARQQKSAEKQRN